jgi:hypothetical protein
MKMMNAEERRAFARAGGLTSAKARAKKMTEAQRQAIARKAAAVRWAKKAK